MPRVRVDKKYYAIVLPVRKGKGDAIVIPVRKGKGKKVLIRRPIKLKQNCETKTFSMSGTTKPVHLKFQDYNNL